MMLPIYKEKVYQLIPQRAPIVMVDALEEANETSALTGLTIAEGNIFLQNGRLQTAGMLEHIAQSAAAYLGWQTLSIGERPRLGYIGEIKRCEVHCHPSAGETLRTRLTLLAEVEGVRLIQAETCVDGGMVCTCQMKLFLKEE